MNIAYCTNVRLPNERAHGHQVAAVVRALSKLGHSVTLFAPFRKNVITESAHEYHDLPSTMKIKHLGSFDPIASTFLFGVLGLWTMNAMLRRALSALDLSSYDLLMTRSPAILAPLLASGKPVLLELHSLPRRSKKIFVEHCNRCAKVVCLTTPMANELKQWGVEEKRIIVEADGVDLPVPVSDEVRKELRAHFGISDSMFVVGYAGSLTTMGLSKGVEQIVDAVATLKKDGKETHALIAGGPPEAVERLRHNEGHCMTFVGQLQHKDVPHLLSACDALIYPAPRSDHPYFLRDTSPLKIFEYMAAERPIITADLPPIHDVLNDDTALFYEPGDVTTLASCIETLMNDQQCCTSLAQRARERVNEHTWEKRMARIISALS